MFSPGHWLRQNRHSLVSEPFRDSSVGVGRRDGKGERYLAVGTLAVGMLAVGTPAEGTSAVGTGLWA